MNRNSEIKYAEAIDRNFSNAKRALPEKYDGLSVTSAKMKLGVRKNDNSMDSDILSFLKSVLDKYAKKHKKEKEKNDTEKSELKKVKTEKSDKPKVSKYKKKLANRGKSEQKAEKV